MVQKKFKINPYLMLIVSFLIIVLLGSFLLSMPFAFRNNPNNEWCHEGTYLDAFFTSLASMSLTGLTTYPKGLADTLSIGGQVVVLILMQIGGLGIVAILTFIISLFRKGFQFKNRLLISQAIAFNNYSDIVTFVRKMMIITLISEVVGFALGIPVFYQIFPDSMPHVLFYSLFHSVSAFNNVGFDLFSGTDSLIDGLNMATGNGIDNNEFLYYYFTLYLSVLSLLGGLSFLVIIDMLFPPKPARRWSSFTKIALSTTGGLVILFALFLFFSDGFRSNHPMNLYQCFIHTINCRTAGFSLYPLAELSLPGRMMSCIVMFIGGSPLSTAGGIKVTTFFVILMSIISYFRGKSTSLFKRRYSDAMIAKSMSIVFVCLFLIVVGFLCLVGFGIKDVDGYQMSENVKSHLYEYYLFEAFSCFSNVGFFTTLEPCLAPGSVIVLCVLMLVGHLGPMTFFQLFQNHLDKSTNVHYSFVEEDFLIG